MRYLLVISLALASVPCAVSAGPLSKQEVLNLNSAGLGDEAVIAKIEADGVSFDLSVDEMIGLKQQGVSSAVIAAMVSAGSKPQMMPESPDPMVAHPAGVYVLIGGGAAARMEKMNPSVSTQAKTGGIWGYALTGGIASASVKAVIPGETAPVKTGSSPTFYFFFDDPSETSGSNVWASGANTIVTSPSEFSLVALKQKDGRREARVGSTNIGGSKVGVMDKDRVAFTSIEVRTGVFKVTAAEPLEPGEYGFIFSLTGGGAGGAMTARIFDFSVG